VRDASDVRTYLPPPALPTANLLYGEIAYVTDKVGGWLRSAAAAAADDDDDEEEEEEEDAWL